MQIKHAFTSVLTDPVYAKYDDCSNTGVSAIVQLLKAKEFEAVVKYWGDILSKDFLDVPHPEHPHIITRARHSKVQAVANLVLFSDENDENQWIWVQRKSLIDAIILPHKILSIYTDGAAKDCLKFLKGYVADEKKYKIQDFNSSFFSGVYLSHHRPYHFFYDEFRTLYSIVEAGLYPDTKEVLFDDPFFDVKSIVKHAKHAGHKPQGVYLRPAILDSQRLYPSKFAWSKKTMSGMEEKINSHALSLPNEVTAVPAHDLMLWIGVTGQKRSWIEQVEGYAQILNKLAGVFQNILVVFDGMTATVGKKIESLEDKHIVDQIVELLPENVKWISVIGEDYITKIKICDQVDFFIANGGTGAMVPLRFCRKPGVQHSNTKLVFPFEDDYEGRLRKVEKKYVVDQNDLNIKEAMHISYHIHWQYLYNHLVTLIAKYKSLTIPLEKPPENQDFDSVDGMSAFRVVGARLLEEGYVEKSEQLPLIMYEIATAFDKMGDVQTAHAIMIQALAQRPTDRVLKDKVYDYRKKLQQSGSSLPSGGQVK